MTSGLEGDGRAARRDDAPPGVAAGKSAAIIVTLSFDDGFARSNLKIAEIYEKHGLSACFNVIATGHLDTFVPPDRWQEGFPTGDFRLWNELQARGHEIMPHGYRHTDKQSLPFEEGQRSIVDCLTVFSRALDGFTPKDAVFNFPYNRSTPALEVWLPSVVRAFRTAGSGINPLPQRRQVKLTTTGHGPGNCEQHLDAMVADLLRLPSGWLIYNTHGVDDEGWGPIAAGYLDRLLDRLSSISTVRIMPTGRALAMANQSSETTSEPARGGASSAPQG